MSEVGKVKKGTKLLPWDTHRSVEFMNKIVVYGYDLCMNNTKYIKNKICMLFCFVFVPICVCIRASLVKFY